MSSLPDGFREDRHPPFARRVFHPAFTGLNPLSLPWTDLRRSPENYPALHVAKVSSARTVVGFEFAVREGESERVYVKRSLLRGAVDKLRARLNLTKEWSELLLACQFARAGIFVPEPLYYAETRIGVEPPAIFYATRALPHPWRPVKEFFKERREFTKVWESLARFTGDLHRIPILHSDYRTDHIFLHEEHLLAGQSPCWALIDLDGSHVGRRVTRAQRQRALHQFAESLLSSGIEEADLQRFLRIYDAESRYAFSAAAILEAVRRKT